MKKKRAAELAGKRKQEAGAPEGEPPEGEQPGEPKEEVFVPLPTGNGVPIPPVSTRPPYAELYNQPPLPASLTYHNRCDLARLF